MANDIKRMKVRLVCKHDTETNWAKASNFKPEKGELIIYDIDNNHSYERMKIGDGNTLVSNLPFVLDNVVINTSNLAKLNDSNTFTGTANTFTNQVDLQGLVRIGKGNSITILSSTSTGLINVNLPSKAGTLALTDDIDVTAAGHNIFTGSNTFTKTDTSGNLYRTLINQNGVSVGGGPGSIVLDITYGFDNIKRLYGDTTYTYTFPNKNGIFATMNDIPNVAPLAKLAQDNTFTGANTFNNGGFKVNSSYGVEALNIDPLNSAGTMHTGMTTLKSSIDQYCSIELGAGSVSISSKGTNNNTGHIDISTGTNGVDFNIAGVTSAVKVLSDGIKVNSKTKYCGGKIDNIVSGTTYSLILPQKTGTFALTSDVSNYVQANPTAVTSVLTSIKIGNISYGIGGGVSLSGNNTWTGSNTFNNINIASGKINNQNTELSLPTVSGTLALTSDLPIKTATLSGSTLSITLNSTNGDSSTSTNSIY